MRWTAVPHTGQGWPYLPWTAISGRNAVTSSGKPSPTSARLRTEAADGFPEKVTAFRPEMAVHGKFKQPCPVCGTAVQRIVYANNECNYCPRCQTGGKLLADRALSRLLTKDFPRTIEDLEELAAARARDV